MPSFNHVAHTQSPCSCPHFPHVIAFDGFLTVTVVCYNRAMTLTKPGTKLAHTIVAWLCNLIFTLGTLAHTGSDLNKL
jgi:hypothetical protein